MPAEPNAPGLFDGLIYLGGAVGAVLLGIAGYMRKPREPAPPTRTTIAGALVDNTVMMPLLDKLDLLTAGIAELVALLKRDIELRAREAEDEAQQERIERYVDKLMEAKRISALMRAAPPADMPPQRGGG